MKIKLLVILFTIAIYVSADAQYTENIKKYNATPNATGLQLGFFEEYSKQAYTLDVMGKRATSRVGFDNWDSIETSPGVYNFNAVITNYARVHNYGEKILGAVNISFTTRITPGKQTIPSFYPNTITDSVTRNAAKAFLRAYVQAVLSNVGSLNLTIDYEIVSNYLLFQPGSQSNAAMWSAWYVEAVAVARQAAIDIGMANNLKLMPIVNGNPFAAGNPIFAGPSQNQWLVNAVNVSDYLALDTYQSDSIYPNTSTQSTFNIIQFWIDNYSGTKDVMVCENGFNTVTQIYPNITRVNRNYKTTGTEADQATFYTSLFNQLGPANLPTGIFHNKLRSYNMWCIRDNTQKAVTDPDRYFGIVGIDSSNNDYLKPAVPIVQNGYATLEADTFHSPENINFNNGIDLTTDLLAGTANDTLTYSNGDDFNFLRYTITNLPSATSYRLYITTVDSGNVIVHINNKWLYYSNNTSFVKYVTANCLPNATNIIDLYFTSQKFPFVQRVKYVKLIPNNITTSIQSAEETNPNEFNLNVPSPNPSGNNNLEISFNVSKPEKVKIDIINTEGILVSEVINKNIDNTDLQRLVFDTQNIAAGIYYLRMTCDNKQALQKFIITK